MYILGIRQLTFVWRSFTSGHVLRVGPVQHTVSGWDEEAAVGDILKNTTFKVGQSEMCPCNVDIMTAEHLLQHCQLHDALRRDMRPEQRRHHDCRTSTAALPTT